MKEDGRAALDDGVADEASRRDAPRRRRRRHRRGDRRDPARARSPCPRLTSSPPSSARSSRSTSPSKRLPSIAGAVVRDGEVLWSDAVGLADAEARRGGDAGPPVPHRLDHEDVHRGRRHAAPRRGQARPRRPARRAPRRARARRPDAAAHALARLGPAARDCPATSGRRCEFPKSTEELLATLERGGDGARAGRAVALLEPRVHPARRGHRASSAASPYEDYVEAADPAAARADADELRARGADGRRVLGRAVQRRRAAASRCSSSARAGSRRPASSGRPSATSAAGRRSSRRPIRTSSSPRVARADDVGADDGRPVPLVARAGASG